MKRRILSILLALVMTLSLLPVTALAETDTISVTIYTKEDGTPAGTEEKLAGSQMHPNSHSLEVEKVYTTNPGVLFELDSKDGKWEVDNKDTDDGICRLVAFKAGTSKSEVETFLKSLGKNGEKNLKIENSNDLYEDNYLKYDTVFYQESDDYQDNDGEWEWVNSTNDWKNKHALFGDVTFTDDGEIKPPEADKNATLYIRLQDEDGSELGNSINPISVINSYAVSTTDGADYVISTSVSANGSNYIYEGPAGGSAPLTGDVSTDGETIYVTLQYTKDDWDAENNNPTGGDGIPDKYQVKVTYKVVNGTWDDNTTADMVKYVTLTNEDGSWSTTGSYAFTAADVAAIPAAGSKPATGYKAGAWDKTLPVVGTTITANVTYTYTYIGTPTPVEPKVTKYFIEYYKEQEDGSYSKDASLTAVAPKEGFVNVGATVTASGDDKIAISGYVFDPYAEGSVLETKAFAPYKDDDEVQQFTTLKLYYSIDAKGDKNPDGTDKGDGIPDKYQVTIQYRSAKDDMGTVGTLTDEVKTISASGTYATTGSVTITGSTATATGDYVFDSWSATADGHTDWTAPVLSSEGASLSNLTIDAKGGATYTFTANFRAPDSVPVYVYARIMKNGAAITGTELADVAAAWGIDLTENDNGNGWLTIGMIENVPALQGVAQTSDNVYDTYGGSINNTTSSIVRYTANAGVDISWITFNSLKGNQYGAIDYTKNQDGTPDYSVKTWHLDGVINVYSVTYTDGVDGKEVFADKTTNYVRAGEKTPAFGETPSRDGYRFIGWEPEVADTVTENVTYTAQWRRSYQPATSAETKPKLNKADHYAYVVGYPDGTVQPQGAITRAEVATIFFRLLSDETRDLYWTKDNAYTDVKAGDWFNNAVSTLSNAGIINGYPDGTFRPNAPITRAEMAKVIAMFAELDKDSEGFKDIAGHWAEAYIKLAAGNGWIAGYPDGTFRPNQYITRAETMTMINRVLERVPSEEEHLLSRRVMLTFPDNQPGDWYYIAVQEATNSHTYERYATEKNGDEQWIQLIDNYDWTKLEF
ncbi:MAG: S-layer homology domain-containing protein [Hominicoprocola sp.]